MDNSNLMRCSTPKRLYGSNHNQNGTTSRHYYNNNQDEEQEQENPWAKIDELQRTVSDLALENEQLRSELILVSQQLVEKDQACMKIREQFYGVVRIFEELYEKIRRMKQRQYMMKTTTTTADDNSPPYLQQAAAATNTNGPVA